MAPRKLSDSDKRQITSIYCQPGETTSTLAQKFGISSSTVSRVLKQMLPDDEYAKLMKWKRSGERGSFPLKDSDVVDRLSNEESPVDAERPVTVEAAAEDGADSSETPSPVESTVDKAEAAESKQPVTRRRSRRRSTAGEASKIADANGSDDDSADTEQTEVAAKVPDKPSPSRTLIKRSQQTQAPPDDDDKEPEVAAWVSEGFGDEDDFDADNDEDWDEETWDEDTDDEDIEPSPVERGAELTILSFERFSLTKPCYLVVDRLAELITCPLKDFSELGVIPSDEEQARTLPVFDNHKIARRFARRNQRIIKVPDGGMLSKTQDYLQAKGITRILFDGRVYALES